MAIITFWNNNTGKIGQTYSAIAIASYMAVEHNYKILLVSTRYNDQVSMQAFGYNETARTVNMLTNNRNSMEMESGIEGMSKLALASRLTPDAVPNYTKMVFKQRLEILSAPRDREGEKIDYDRIYSSMPSILGVAKKHYDIVFVDLNNGFKEHQTKEILGISDAIIVNIEQKMTEIDEIKELKEKEKIFTPRNTMILLNNYDRTSKYTSKNISRYLGEKREILTVPHNNLFSEAVQEATAAEFFVNPRLRNLEDVEDKTAFFMNELKRDSEAIIYKMQELQMRA